MRRDNAEGPEALRNRPYTHSHRAQPLRSPEQLAELAEAVRGPAPEGDHWLGRTVAGWMRQRLGRPISVYLGWAYLVRLDGKRRKPRPRQVPADPDAQAACNKRAGRSSRPSPPRTPRRASSSGPPTNTASG